MNMHFLIDSDEDAERCRKSLQTRTTTVVTGFDPMTGRIRSYSGVVLTVEPIESLGEHWRITIETGDAPARIPLNIALQGDPWGINRNRVSSVLAGVR
jgi:hypothetical protein